MADNFKELLKKAEAEKRQKAGLEPLEEAAEEEKEELPTEETAVEKATSSENDESLNNKEEVAPRHANEERKGLGKGRIVAVCIGLITLAAVIYIAIIGILDFTGIGKSDKLLEIEIPAGTSNEVIAAILEKNDLIDHPLIFRIYSKLSGKGGSYQAGTYNLSADMGYDGLAQVLMEGNPRETVSVTIPEGYTIDQIAKRLEEKEVCTAQAFYDALINETYTYDFLDGLPKLTGEYAGRLYRLEGYLFPDTYEFFKESEAKDIVDRFLQNFDSKLTKEMRAEIKKRNLTVDEIVIMASIAEKEAATDADLPKVVRVLYNRLESNYTRLECDSTFLYIKNLPDNIANADVISASYDTYKRNGLPVGAISNPGLAALKAAVYPSDDSYIAECFYFANDDKGVTYYSKTFEQHKAACREHGIGIYG